MGIQSSCDICEDSQPFLYIEYTNVGIKKYAKEYPLEKDGNPFPPLEHTANILYKKNIQNFKIYREGSNSIKICQILCKKCSNSFLKSPPKNVKIYKLCND